MSAHFHPLLGCFVRSLHHDFEAHRCEISLDGPVDDCGLIAAVLALDPHVAMIRVVTGTLTEDWVRHTPIWRCGARAVRQACDLPGGRIDGGHLIADGVVSVAQPMEIGAANQLVDGLWGHANTILDAADRALADGDRLLTDANRILGIT